MIRQPISRRTELLLGAASICFVVLFYSFLSYRQHQRNARDTTMPTLRQFVEGWKFIATPKTAIKWNDPSDEKVLAKYSAPWRWCVFIYRKFDQTISRIPLLIDLSASGKRLFSAVFVGVVLSFFIGIGMAVYRPMEALFKWPILGLGNVPPTAMLAVYFVLFGTDLQMYIATIAFGILPSLTMAIFNAANTDVSDHSIFKAYTLGTSSGEVIWEVVVQQILPRIIDNVRLMIGPAMVFLIAAEWGNASEGFGYRLRLESRMSHMNIVYTYLAILGLSGFGLDRLLLYVRRKWCPWFELKS